MTGPSRLVAWYELPRVRTDHDGRGMVELVDIISPDSVILDLPSCSSKRQVLRELAQRAAAAAGVETQTVLEALTERERLGTTGIGHGIAIPHARLDGLNRLVGLFVRLDQPVDFEALDQRPSDLIFLLLAPSAAEADSLRALARISRLLRDPALRQRLRKEPDPRAVYRVLTQNPESMPRSVVARTDPSASCDLPPAAHAHVRLHASCVQLGGVGVVLLGASGAGKSDLRAAPDRRRCAAGGRRSAPVEATGTGLVGRPAEVLAGLLEVRGIGILRAPLLPGQPAGAGRRAGWRATDDPHARVVDLHASRNRAAPDPSRPRRRLGPAKLRLVLTAEQVD